MPIDISLVPPGGRKGVSLPAQMVAVVCGGLIAFGVAQAQLRQHDLEIDRLRARVEGEIATRDDIRRLETRIDALFVELKRTSKE